MENAHKKDVAAIIEFAKKLPNCQSMGQAFACIIAAACEIACHYEPDPEVTIREIAKAVHVVYRHRRKVGQG